MNKKDLEILRSAIRRSPDNIALRLSYALKLFKLKEYQDSEINYQHVLKLDPDNIKAKQGLMELYFTKENYSTVIVIAEELAHRNISSEKIMELHAKALLKQNSIEEAQNLYNKILQRNPFYYDEELDSVLDDAEEYYDEMGNRTINSDDDEDFDEFDDYPGVEIPEFLSNPQQMFLPKTEPGYSDVFGMHDTKQHIKELYMHLDLDENTLQKYGLTAGASLLLYGPPGCGKTLIVSRTPYEHEVDIIPFDWNRVSNGQGISKEFIIPFYFNIARINTPLTIFYDNFDTIFNQNLINSSMEANKYKHQFEMEVDAMYAYNQSITIIAATNAVWQIDPTFFRYGRFDTLAFVAPPSINDRKEFFSSTFDKMQLDLNVSEELLAATNQFSYADLSQIMNMTIKSKLQHAIEKQSKPIGEIDENEFLNNVKKFRSNTKTWFDVCLSHTDTGFKNTAIYQEVHEYVQENMK
jgi:transitional endoplasmic reticulum ATPase